jgi:DNA-binding response OmpR family regulator
MDILGRRPHVLIADDHRDLAKTLALLLNLAGFDAETVHDGRDALKAARAHRPDVLLLDISLPGLDGVRVTEQMRGDPLLSNVLIIATSAYDSDMFRGRSRQASFDHRLVKPVAFQTILSLLARIGHSSDRRPHRARSADRPSRNAKLRPASRPH